MRVVEQVTGVTSKAPGAGVGLGQLVEATLRVGLQVEGFLENDAHGAVLDVVEVQCTLTGNFEACGADVRYEIGTCESSPSVSTLKDISLLIPIHYRLSDFLRRHQGGEVGVCAGYNWKHRGVANPQALNTPDAAGRVGD